LQLDIFKWAEQGRAIARADERFTSISKQLRTADAEVIGEVNCFARRIVLWLAIRSASMMVESVQRTEPATKVRGRTAHVLVVDASQVPIEWPSPN
jgi:hypothetical protein